MRRLVLLLILALPAFAQGIPLTTAAREGLVELLVAPGGAYQSYALYAKALAILGPAEPYRHFLDGERAKVEAVKEALVAYGVNFPKRNPYLGTVALPRAKEALARVALAREVKSVYLERRLSRVFADYDDLSRLVRTLEAADQLQAKLLRMAIAQGGALGPDVVRGMARDLRGQEVCVFAFGAGLCR